MKDFPVPVSFTETAKAVQLAAEASSGVTPWPASFVEVALDQWVYRVDLTDVNDAAVQAALDAHVPQPDSQDRANDLRAKAAAALDANATFLALASPSNAQTLAQVQRLTRECNALIRLVIGRLDDTTGT